MVVLRLRHSPYRRDVMKQYVDGGNNNVSRCKSDVDKAGKALAPHIFWRQGRAKAAGGRFGGDAK